MNPLLLAAALVWVPPETFTQWSKVDALMRSQPELKLTIAVTPSMTTGLAKAALEPWTKSGRVEVAARVHGDPVLPLVASHPAAPRPDDALERAADAVRIVAKRMGAASAGFVPGAGRVDASLVGPVAASDADWVLVGPYDGSATAWAASGKTAFVPGRSAPGGGFPSRDDLLAPGVLVVDESAAAEARLPAALAELGGAKPASGWALLGEVAKAAPRGPADGVADWPDWNGTVPAAPTDPGVRAALSAYGDAAKALARYQNSGAADLKVLEGATELLRRAQDARFYRPAADGAAPGLAPDLRERLLAVYKRLKTPAPDALYSVGAATAAVVADLPTGVRVFAGADRLAFDNPLGTTARQPAGAPNSDPWRLRGLRVEWSADRVVIRFLTGRVDAAPAAPVPVYDAYVDLNHVLGAGSIRLLEGRGAFAQARDAWEFALTVRGTDARLYRAGSAGDPEELAALRAEPDPSKAEVAVTVPRELLRGNPARWGWIALALAEDPARAGRFPPAILVGPDGAQTLGLLGALEVQKSVLEKPGSPQRVPAVRVDSAAP